MLLFLTVCIVHCDVVFNMSECKRSWIVFLTTVYRRQAGKLFTYLCGAIETSVNVNIVKVFNMCPLTKFEGRFQSFHNADGDTLNWLKTTATLALLKWSEMLIKWRNFTELGRDRSSQKNAAERTGAGTAQDKFIERLSQVASCRSRSPSIGDGDFVAYHPSSPPIPAVKHRPDTYRCDVQSRRTARAPGIIHCAILRFLQHFIMQTVVWAVASPGFVARSGRAGN